MKLNELKKLIAKCGGQKIAQEKGHRLLKKINLLLKKEHYKEKLLKQFTCASNAGDFRGRVFEINVAYRFLQKQIILDCAVKQGCTGDIDFLWKNKNFNIYMELKYLGQSSTINEAISKRINKYGGSAGILTKRTIFCVILCHSLSQSNFSAF
ncbi:MAG: hypothetical protein QM652_13740 [Legionella sp.]|uniref:hypothetical protein n=1 Tax=Legionella sp. TaxID=459 RepID=UPI0039E382A9